MNTEQLREFVSLEKTKLALDAELKAVKQRLDNLEQALVPQFIADGVARMTVDGRAISLAQDIYASPLNDRSEVAAALKMSELGQYVAENYNSNSLSAFVREVAREVELVCQQQERLFTEDEVRAALPEPLGKTLKVSFVYALRSRKA
ncbi:MAG: hypothetical protein KIT09_28040 [Bryobacteraceae bacterium]|nr:hypothetical protein [Bryobacteraceae bacterium]